MNKRESFALECALKLNLIKSKDRKENFVTYSGVRNMISLLERKQMFIPNTNFSNA